MSTIVALLGKRLHSPKHQFDHVITDQCYAYLCVYPHTRGSTELSIALNHAKLQYHMVNKPITFGRYPVVKEVYSTFRRQIHYAVVILMDLRSSAIWKGLQEDVLRKIMIGGKPDLPTPHAVLAVCARKSDALALAERYKDGCEGNPYTLTVQDVRVQRNWIHNLYRPIIRIFSGEENTRTYDGAVLPIEPMRLGCWFGPQPEAHCVYCEYFDWDDWKRRGFAVPAERLKNNTPSSALDESSTTAPAPKPMTYEASSQHALGRELPPLPLKDLLRKPIPPRLPPENMMLIHAVLSNLGEMLERQREPHDCDAPQVWLDKVLRQAKRRITRLRSGDIKTHERAMKPFPRKNSGNSRQNNPYVCRACAFMY